MKKILLFLFSLLMSIEAWGAITTLTFTSACGGSGTADDGSVWIVASDAAESTFDNTRGIHYGTSKAAVSYLNITTAQIDGTITQIKVNASGASGTKAKLNVTVNGNDFGSQQSLTSTATEYTFNGSSNGTIIVSLSQSSTKKALYCKSIEVTYSSGSSLYTVTWISNRDTVYVEEDKQYNDKVSVVPSISVQKYCGDTVIGWTTSEYFGNTMPYIFSNVIESPYIRQNTTFYAVFTSYDNTANVTYYKSELNSLTSEDVFIIVCKNDAGYYAMSNNNGTNKSPDAIHFIPIGNFIFTDSTNVLWNITKNGNHYKFHSNGDTLYCRNDNNGVRVGKGKANDFIISDGYLYENDSTHRFIGVYNNTDWRCYTNTTGNIANQTFEFYKRVKNITDFHTACVREFNDTKNDSLWTTKTSWTNGKLPTSKYAAQINNPVIVDTEHAVAKHVIINQNTGNGKIIIHPNKGLEVDSTIVVHKENLYTSTTPNDLILESSESGNASLIFNNNNGSQATVCLYSKAYIDRTVTPNKWNWQYIGTPMASVNALYNYYDSWIYEWAKNDGWTPVPNGGTMRPWTGYCITQETPGWYATTGTLIPTDDIKELALTVPAGKDMVFANSWTAPIHISKMVESGFVMNPMTLYLFNTGSAPEGSVQGTEAGTHIVVPIHAAPYLKDTLIAPQQGFFVTNKNGDSEGSITMNYKKLVRCSDSIVAGPMYAPRRVDTTLSKPNVLKIYASGSVYGDDVTILSREDFSTEFDNGWDGEKTSFGKMSPSIYVMNNDGSYDAVSAIPSYEGVLIGFRRGADDAYTLTFEYDGYETLYLNDILTKESTMIDGESRYIFTSGDSEEARFVISSTPYSGVTTNIEDLTKQSCRARKFLYNGNLYIFKNNCIFNIEGSLIQR